MTVHTQNISASAPQGMNGAGEQNEAVSDALRVLQHQRDNAMNMLAQAEVRFLQYQRAAEKQIADLKHELDAMGKAN